MMGGTRESAATANGRGHERHTRQQRSISELFSREMRPMPPTEVLRLVKPEVPRIGIATVYRAIRRLVDEKSLVAVEIPGLGTCYEVPRPKPHHSHFLCTACKRVFELKKDSAIAKSSLPAGFVIDDYEVLLKGTCAECRGTGR